MTMSAPPSSSASRSAEDRRVVGEVGVHLHQRLVALGQAELEALPVGAAEPGLGRPAQHLDAAQLVGQGLGQIGRAVGAVVVDHEDVDRRAWPTARMRRSTSAMVAASLYVGSTTRVFTAAQPYRPGLTVPGSTGTIRPWNRPSPPPAGRSDEHPYAASRGALIGAFVAVVVAGLSGAAIGFGLVDIGCTGDCGTSPGSAPSSAACWPPAASPSSPCFCSARWPNGKPAESAAADPDPVMQLNRDRKRHV